MANSYKVLGQLAGSTTATALYTCPSSTEAVISTLLICNRAAAAKTYKIILRPDDETLADKHYLAFDVSIAANDTTALTLGITMNASDKLYVSSSDTNLSFTAFGSEIA
ncbi:hypothetical protein UFOVP744_36 [uncultured Caudovirales phage]|uniref:Uncharacterized protein n=1 Tax=uncultured Caudovirales phage TaxID=2100421 RepID=A0A6J7X5F4_9CAUD|nr:hypothetical protein UFOVP744_36 [uncultured Caudovirales phage]